MATDWQTFPLEFKGGLISNLTPLQQGTNAIGSATILENFEPSLTGGYSKIKGFKRFNPLAITGSGKIQSLALVSNGYTAIAVRNDKYFVVTSSSILQAHSNSATNYAGRTALSGGKVRFVNYDFGAGEKTIFVDGTNAPAFYDGNANSTSVSFANPAATEFVPTVGAKFVTEFKNHLVLGKGSSVIIGDTNTDNSFATNALELQVKSTVTGLIVFREQLIIFTKDSIQKITGSASTGSDPFVLTPITKNIGCIREDTIQEVGGDILFFAPDGIRSLAATERIGDFSLDVASQPIKEDVDTLSATSFDSIVIREKAQYRLFAYNDSVDNLDSVGLIATKFIAQGGTGINWARTRGVKSYASDSRYYGEVGALGELIIFANTDGYVYQLESTAGFVDSSNNAVNITAIYESPFMPINDPAIRKTFYKLLLFLEPEGGVTANVNIKYDQDEIDVIQPPTIQIETTGQGISKFNDVNFAYASGTPPSYADDHSPSFYSADLDKLYRNNVVGSGKTVAIRIEESSTKPSFRLDTAVLEYSVETRQ